MKIFHRATLIKRSFIKATLSANENIVSLPKTARQFLRICEEASDVRLNHTILIIVIFNTEFHIFYPMPWTTWLFRWRYDNWQMISILLPGDINYMAVK
jgi:hypothetical protein